MNIAWKTSQCFYRAGVGQPAVAIRFTDLTVETEVFADLSRNLPSIFRALRDPIEVLPLASDLCFAFDIFHVLAFYVDTKVQVVLTAVEGA